MVRRARGEDAVDQQLVFAHMADAAALASGTRGIAPDVEALHHHRILGLDDFDRRAGREMVHRQHDRRSVVGAGAAERGHHQLVLHGRLAGAALGVADRDRAGAEAGRRHRARRIELAERGEHAGVDHVRGREIVVHGRGILRVDQRARRHDEIDRVEHAGIHRDGGIGGGDDREQRDRLGGRAGGVDRALGLRVGAGKIEREPVAALARRYLDAHGLGAVGAVVIEQRLRVVLAVGPAGELAAHPRRRAREQACHGGLQGVGAVLVAERGEPLGAEPRAADLAAQVADDHFGHPAVVAQDCLDLAVDAVLGPVAHRRDQHAVVEDLARGGAGGAGHQAADVGLVGDAGAEGDDLAAVKDRRDHHDVRHVRVAGLVGIIGDKAVAVAHLGHRVALAHAGDGAGI